MSENQGQIPDHNAANQTANQNHQVPKYVQPAVPTHPAQTVCVEPFYQPGQDEPQNDS